MGDAVAESSAEVDEVTDEHFEGFGCGCCCEVEEIGLWRFVIKLELWKLCVMMLFECLFVCR